MARRARISGPSLDQVKVVHVWVLVVCRGGFWDEAVAHDGDLDGIILAGGWFVGLGLFKAVACLLQELW